MRTYGAAHLSGDPSSPQEGAIPAFELSGRRSQGRVSQVEQLNLSSPVREIQQAGQLLAHTLDVREAKIIALRQEIESGRYRIKTEQVAEKIMTDYLLDLFCPNTHRRSARS